MPAEIANTDDEAEKVALLEFANELAGQIGVSKDEKSVANIVSKLRWYPNKAGAVVIVKRGSDRTVLATISPQSGKWSHLYPSWIPVLARLANQKKTDGVDRMSHDGLLAGEIPANGKVLANEK